MLENELTVLEAEAKAAVAEAASVRANLSIQEQERIRRIAAQNKGKGKRKGGRRNNIRGGKGNKRVCIFVWRVCNIRVGLLGRPIIRELCSDRPTLPPYDFSNPQWPCGMIQWPG